MNQCSSSSMNIVLHCDDLVTEILLRLPVNSVFKFKCVSKTWNRLISDPIFCCNYQSLSRRKNSLLPLLGFFRVSLLEDRSTLELSFLPNGKEKKFTKLKLDLMENYFPTHGSPQGLILCSSETLQMVNYYVCDPVRNQCLALPRPPPPNKGLKCFSVGFSCEECTKDGVVHFKVIEAMRQQRHRAIHDNHTYDRLAIKTFSSHTGKWSESFLASPSEFSLGQPLGCDSVDGIFFWKVRGHFAAYDPNNNKLGEKENQNQNQNQNRLWLIEFPPGCDRGDKFMNYILGQSPVEDGCLRFALNDKLTFTVWDLKKKLSGYSLFHVIPSSEWRLKEEVSYRKLDIIDYFATGYDPCIRSLNKYPSLMAFHPRNSKLVYLRRGSRLFCYDLETRRLEPIVRYHRGTSILPNHRLIPYFQPPWPRPSLPSLHY